MKLLIEAALILITAIFLAKRFPVFRRTFKNVTYRLGNTKINVAIDEEYFSKTSFNDVFAFVLEQDENRMKALLEDDAKPASEIWEQYAEEKVLALTNCYKNLYRLKANGTVSSFEIKCPFGGSING